MDALPVEFEENTYHLHVFGQLSSNAAELNAYIPSISITNDWQQNILKIAFHELNQSLVLSSDFMVCKS